jgi:hypothetical protein
MIVGFLQGNRLITGEFIVYKNEVTNGPVEKSIKCGKISFFIHILFLLFEKK